MKKLLSLFIASAMLMTSFVAVHGDENDITVFLDGKEIEFDVKPQIMNERTMVPMRAIFETLGSEVDWDDSTKTVTAAKDGTEIIMNVGYSQMFVNLEPVTIDVPPVIVDSRTLVPLRAISESFKCNVDWDEDTYTVTITSNANIITGSGPAVSDGSNLPASGHGPAMPTQSPNPTTQTEPGPVISDASSAPEASAAPTATAAPDASAAPEASPAPSESAEPSPAPDTNNGGGDIDASGSGSGLKYDIEYDSSREANSHSARDFQITEIDTNANGDYEIRYTVRTYREDSGNIAVTFDCLDSTGKKIGSFSDIFHSWAYSWTPQESTAVLPAGTAKIELVLE